MSETANDKPAGVDGSAASLSYPPLALRPYYQDAHCTIYHGDCREILPTLGRFDLLLTDPPYGIGAGSMTMGKGQSDKAKQNRIEHSDWDQVKPEVAWCLSSAKYACVWGGNYWANDFPESNDWLIWHKLNDGRSFSECEMAWTTFGKQTRVLQWSWLHGGETKQHKTQKPVALMRWCLGFVPDAQTILDPFAGSCTTGVAAKLEGRKAVLIEISEKYCEIGAERLRQGVLF